MPSHKTIHQVDWQQISQHEHYRPGGNRMAHSKIIKKVIVFKGYYTQQNYPSGMKEKQILQDIQNLRDLITIRTALQKILKIVQHSKWNQARLEPYWHSPKALYLPSSHSLRVLYPPKEYQTNFSNPRAYRGHCTCKPQC